jgi:hypothetical protein
MKDSPFRRSPELAGVLLTSVAMLASAPPLSSVEIWENEGLAIASDWPRKQS